MFALNKTHSPTLAVIQDNQTPPPQKKKKLQVMYINRIFDKVAVWCEWVVSLVYACLYQSDGAGTKK